MSFNQLMHEHDRIEELTHRLETMCGESDPGFEAVLAVRADLKDALDHHLGHEDATIYAGLILASGEPAEAVRVFTETFAELRDDWGTYLEDWNAECLAADWDHFCAETHSLMARVRDRTRQETSLIYPLALQTGAIRLREPAVALQH